MVRPSSVLGLGHRLWAIGVSPPAPIG